VLRLRRDIVRAAAEDFTAQWPSRPTWPSRFAQKANGSTARSSAIIRSSVLEVN
jgi:hypothetical protein